MSLLALADSGGFTPPDEPYSPYGSSPGLAGDIDRRDTAGHARRTWKAYHERQALIAVERQYRRPVQVDPTLWGDLLGGKLEELIEGERNHPRNVIRGGAADRDGTRCLLPGAHSMPLSCFVSCLFLRFCGAYVDGCLPFFSVNQRAMREKKCLDSAFACVGYGVKSSKAWTFWGELSTITFFFLLKHRQGCVVYCRPLASFASSIFPGPEQCFPFSDSAASRTELDDARLQTGHDRAVAAAVGKPRLLRFSDDGSEYIADGLGAGGDFSEMYAR